MHIVFLNPSVTFARFRKRIVALKNEGFKTKVFAFERKHYTAENIPGDYISLGMLNHGNYLVRLIHLFRIIYKVRRGLKDTQIIYVFGLDMALLGWLSVCYNRYMPKIVYEVGDIRELFLGKHLINCFARSVDRFIVKRVYLLIVTSKAFLTEYFEKRLNVYNLNYLEIENKIDESQLCYTNRSNYRTNKKLIRIGYFGVIRCQQSWNILKSVLLQSPDKIVLVVYGVPSNIYDFENDCKTIETIQYKGSYISPTELPKIYSSVDIVWIAGSHGSENYRWAKRCRYYESGYFRKPMIAQVGTQDGELVQKYQIGLVLDLDDSVNVVDKVNQLSRNDLDAWESNIRKLPLNHFIYTNEHAVLRKRLTE